MAADIPQSLDAMQKSINLVLIEVGKVFQKSKRNGNAPSPGNMKIQNAIPTLESRFHDALDDVEYEICRAKAVLLHDLREIQAKKAAAMKPNQEPAPSTRQSPEKPTDQAQMAGFDAGRGVPQAQVNQGSETETTLDRLQKSIGAVQKIVQSPNAVGNEVQPAKATGESYQTPSNESLFAGATKSGNNARKPSPDGIRNDGTTLKETTSKDDTQNTELSNPDTGAIEAQKQANSTDIDSLFDESNSNPNTSQNAEFADIDFTAGGGDDFTFSSNTAPANTDLDSLMPGIGSYATANQSDDFNMMDFSNHTDGANDNVNTNVDTDMNAMIGLSNDNDASTNNNDNNNSGMGMSESNFDDLLEGMDFGDADEGLGGGGAMEHGEFDDAFFGLTTS